MTEPKKRPVHNDVPVNGARPKAIDARKAMPMNGMANMQYSTFAKGMHAGMTKKSVFAEPDPKAIPMPTKHAMRVERRPLPPPEKKEVTEDSEKLAETKKLLDVAYKRIEIVEREKGQLREDIEKRDQVIANLKSEIKNESSELKTLLAFLHYDTVELLIKDVNAYKVYLQKSRARKERYEARHYG